MLSAQQHFWIYQNDYRYASVAAGAERWKTREVVCFNKGVHKAVNKGNQGCYPRLVEQLSSTYIDVLAF